MRPFKRRTGSLCWATFSREPRRASITSGRSRTSPASTSSPIASRPRSRTRWSIGRHLARRRDSAPRRWLRGSLQPRRTDLSVQLTQPSSRREDPLPTRSRSLTPDTSGASKSDIMELTEKLNVRFMRLQFTDILGINKNVEIPSSQFEKALDGDIMFDGSSIEGFVRIEESDMLLVPDLETFLVYPWGDPESRICRLICDIRTPEGEFFAGDPRGTLKAVLAKARAMGYVMNAGMEAEFFLFKPVERGNASTTTH